MFESFFSLLDVARPDYCAHEAVDAEMLYRAALAVSEALRRLVSMWNRRLLVTEKDHSDWLFNLANQCMRGETENEMEAGVAVVNMISPILWHFLVDLQRGRKKHLVRFRNIMYLLTY